MTALLQQAFEAAGRFSESEQDVIAARPLAEIAQEVEFDSAIERTAVKLVGLAGGGLG